MSEGGSGASCVEVVTCAEVVGCCSYLLLPPHAECSHAALLCLYLLLSFVLFIFVLVRAIMTGSARVVRGASEEVPRSEF